MAKTLVTTSEMMGAGFFMFFRTEHQTVVDIPGSGFGPIIPDNLQAMRDDKDLIDIMKYLIYKKKNNLIYLKSKSITKNLL